MRTLSRYLPFFVALTTICFGCGKEPQTTDHASRRPRHLADLTCSSSDAPQAIVINVAANDDVFAHEDDDVIFVCEGDTLQWVAGSDSLKITVELKGRHADELFVTGDKTITGTNRTSPETIAHPKKHVLHKYKIEVEDTSAHKKFSIDPHIIPMGKGGS